MDESNKQNPTKEDKIVQDKSATSTIGIDIGKIQEITNFSKSKGKNKFYQKLQIKIKQLKKMKTAQISRKIRTKQVPNNRK